MLWSKTGKDQEQKRKRSWTIKQEKIKNKKEKYQKLKQENIMILNRKISWNKTGNGKEHCRKHKTYFVTDHILERSEFAKYLFDKLRYLLIANIEIKL